MATPTQTRRILIKVDTNESKALRSIADQMGLLNQNTKSLAGNMQFLSNAFRSWLGFLGVRELTRLSDEMQNLFNRLKLVSGNLEGAKEAMEGLLGVADRTNQSISDVGTVYTRFAIALKSAGANTKELLSLTETLVNSFRVSGSNASETANAMVQLSQAFSVGVLRGQDLRSVLEQNSVIASLLKQRFGADLFKKAEEGAISITEVLRILSKSQEQINEGAKKLAPTFEQTLTKATNKLSVAVGELNDNFQLSAKFAVVMGVAMDHLGEILTVLGGILAVVAVTRIPAMIDGLNKLRLAFIGFAAANPLTLALTTLATVGALIVENWDKVSNTLTKARASFLDLAADIEEKGLGIRQKLADATGSTILQEQIDRSKKGIESMREAAQGLRDSISLGAKGKDPLSDMGKNLESLTDKLAKMPGPTKKIKDILGELNAQLLAGKITLEQYNKKLLDFDLYKFNRQFKEGKFDVLKYNQALFSLDLQRLNRGMANGTKNLRQFNVEIAASKLAVLNEQLALGVIGLAEYNAELIKLDDKVRPGSSFYVGLASFIESAGTISQGIAKVTQQAFDHLSDTLSDFIKTGKFEFKDFTKAVLDDITQMVVRAAIIRPIAGGILDLIGVGTVGGGGAVGAAAPSGGFSIASPGEFQFANGGIMTSRGALPLNKYANGGIASSPQVAMFGEGRKPEAYVPLPDGRQIPVDMQGGNGIQFTQIINIDSEGGSTESGSGTGENAKQFGSIMKQVAIDTIIQQQRPGGLLSRG